MMTSKIALCLPKPNMSGGTELAAKSLTFDVNLSYYAFEQIMLHASVLYVYCDQSRL